MSEGKKQKGMPDSALVSLARSGDKRAMDELFERYKNIVRAHARRFFLVGGEVEDLIQEGMIGLYEAVTSYDEGKASFKSFANLCINRRIVDAVKSATRQKNMPLNDYVSIFSPNFDLVSEDSIEGELIERENRTELLQTLGQALSKFEFQVVVCYMDGMSYDQISKATGKSEKSIDNALQRSKKKLASILR